MFASIPIPAVLRNRISSHAGYRHMIHNDIEGGDQFPLRADQLEHRQIVAVTENVEHGRRQVSYDALTSEWFAEKHRNWRPEERTAWFFRWDQAGVKWEFMGFGRSPDDLWEPGTYAAP